MSATPARPAAFYSVLGYDGFRKLWLGQVISNVGDTFTSIAQLILVNQITGSTLALAGMAIALALPRLLFGLIAGVFVDRLDRRTLMIVADVLRALLVLPMALVQRPDQIWIFYVCGFATSTVATLFDPAKNALVPKLVPEAALTQANALSQSTLMVASLAGPLIAGFMLDAFAPSLAFVIDAVSFAVSAVAILRIVAPPYVRESAAAAGLRAAVGHILAEAGEGLRVLGTTRAVLAVALVFAVVMLGVGAINVLAVAYLTRNFGVGASGLGMVITLQAVGMIAGSVAAGQWLGGMRPARVVSAGLALTAACLIALAFAPTYPVVLGICVVLGLAMAPVEAISSTLLQTAIPDAQRGRVGAAINTVIVTATLVSMSLAGVAGAVIGVAQVFIVGGLIVLAAAGLAAWLLSTTPAPGAASAPRLATET